MVRARSRLAVVAALVVVVFGGCGGGGDGRADLDPDTARFSYGERAVVVPLAECGRDGDVVLAAGQLDAVVLQVAADVGGGGVDRSAVTVDLGDDGVWGAFGADASVGPGPAGEITGVAVDGDVVTVDGRWARLDGELRPDPGQPPMEGRVQARCPGAAAA